MRDFSTTLQDIFAKPSRNIVKVLQISFPTIPTLFLASDPVTISAQNYINDIEKVSAITGTLENPVNRVSIQLQNKDDFYRSHFQTNFDEWQRAFVRLYRLYDNTELVNLFDGSATNFDLSDFSFSFVVIDELIADGNIIANRNLGLRCPWKFKSDSCGSTSPAITCNKLLKSKNGGCAEYGQQFRNGSFDSYIYPVPQPPGAGNNQINNRDTGEIFPNPWE